MYKRIESAVIVGQDITEWFKQTVGVRQGCLLSPDLFNFYLEHIMRAALDGLENEIGASIAGRKPVRWWTKWLIKNKFCSQNTHWEQCWHQSANRMQQDNSTDSTWTTTQVVGKFVENEPNAHSTNCTTKKSGCCKESRQAEGHVGKPSSRESPIESTQNNIVGHKIVWIGGNWAEPTS